MSKLVAHGATLRCDRGTSEATLTVKARGQDGDEAPLATVDDHASDNLAPFGDCTSIDNPEVAQATATAGTLTPRPCRPVVTEPWEDEVAFVRIEGRPALTDGSTCRCRWAGTIAIAEAGSAHRAEG